MNTNEQEIRSVESVTKKPMEMIGFITIIGLAFVAILVVIFWWARYSIRTFTSTLIINLLTRNHAGDEDFNSTWPSVGGSMWREVAANMAKKGVEDDDAKAEFVIVMNMNELSTKELAPKNKASEEQGDGEGAKDKTSVEGHCYKEREEGVEGANTVGQDEVTKNDEDELQNDVSRLSAEGRRFRKVLERRREGKKENVRGENGRRDD